MNRVQFPYDYIPEKSVGRPLFDADLYFGIVDLDPEIPANQIDVYGKQEDGSSVLLPQPVNTGAGGVPLYNGSPVELLAAELNYSFKALSRTGAQIYYAENVASVLTSDLIPDLIIVIDNVVALATYPAASDTVYYLKEYHTGTGFGGGELLAYTGADTPNNVTIFASGVAGILFKRINYERISVHMAGARGDGVTNDTAAFQLAIIANRGASQIILDTIGGSLITAYDNGLIDVPPGNYILSYDTFNITQDIALGFVGSGSRRQTNYHNGKTVLKFTGTSSGYAIRMYGNGSRGLALRDLDLVYTGNTFTGDMIDAMDAVGLVVRDCYIGTSGTSGGTRYQTARSLIRTTYDEMIEFQNCTFDGAVKAWWSDNSRTEYGNTFGGAATSFYDCVFYDFTGSMFDHDGTRTRSLVTVVRCGFNPISVDCTKAINFNNMDGLTLSSCIFVPSTLHNATSEWVTLVNVTGILDGCMFGDLSKAGTLDGMIVLSGCSIFCTDGFTLTGGVISSKSNEFGKGTNGFLCNTLTAPLSIDLGPDLFKSSVTNSYNITDNANLSGRINYSADTDGSTNAFSNTSGRITIKNIDGKRITVSTTPYTINKKDTGRHFFFAGAANQVCNVPVSTPGTSFKITKVSNFDLSIDRTSTNNFYAGVGGVKTQIKFLAADIGGTATLDANGAVGYISDVQGTVTYT